MTRKLNKQVGEVYWHGSNLVVRNKQGNTTLKTTGVNNEIIKLHFAPAIANQLINLKKQSRDVHLDMMRF